MDGAVRFEWSENGEDMDSLIDAGEFAESDEEESETRPPSYALKHARPSRS